MTRIQMIAVCRKYMLENPDKISVENLAIRALGNDGNDERDAAKTVLSKLFPDSMIAHVREARTREATIDDLLKYVENRHRDGDIIEFLENYEYYPSACGCMGPRDGEPLCPCAMRAAVHQNKLTLIERLNQDTAIEIAKKKVLDALRGLSDDAKASVISGINLENMINLTLRSS